MALSHLIQLKPRSNFCKIRFSQPTRWSCSSSTTDKKPTSLRKIEKASAVESVVNKNGESNLSYFKFDASTRGRPKDVYYSAEEGHLGRGTGMFPSVTLAQKKIVGSWYTIKDIMLNLKEKIIRNTGAPSQSNRPNRCEVGASESNVMNILSDGNNLSTSTTEILKESSTVETKDMPATKKLGSTASESRSDMIASDSEANLGPGNEIGERNGSSGNHAQKDMALPEVLMNYLSKLSSVNPKQPYEGLAGSLLRSEMDPNSKSAQSQTIKVLQQSVEEMSNSTGCKSHQPAIQAESRALPKTVSEVGAMSSMSTESAKNAIRLKDLSEKRTDLPKEGELMIEIKSGIHTRSIFKDSSSDSQEEVAKDSDVSVLINLFKKRPPREQLGLVQPQGSINSTKLNQLSDLIGEVQSQGVSQLSDNNGKQNLLNRQAMVEKMEKNRGLGMDSMEAPLNSIKSTSSTKVPLSSTKKAALSVKPVLSENKAILRFLPIAIEDKDIANAFKNRDDIVNIECSYVEGSKYKTAQVHFKTRDGLLKALKTTYLVVNQSTFTIEAASALDSLSNRICIPDLIGDPCAPAMLLKNPSNTVMIKDLTDDISSHHIQEALLPFSESEISAFFLGSSNSVAYVEFKTEEGKDRALAKHSILVEGKSLSIFRVDTPRTTVIRISTVERISSVMKEIIGLCKSCGQIKDAFSRDNYTADVHFAITEWPNMLRILNRLNGKLVKGQRLQAKPAPVFPPEVIHALWGHPEERRRLKGLMRNLFQKLEEDFVPTTDILDLAARYYRDD